MTQGPVDELTDAKLSSIDRKALVIHIEALYRRQDSFDDHECRLRRCAASRNPEAPQPPREHPVPRYDDRVLSSIPLDEVAAHARAVQRRLRDYIDTFARLHAAAALPEAPKAPTRYSRLTPEQRERARAAHRRFLERHRERLNAQRRRSAAS